MSFKPIPDKKPHESLKWRTGNYIQECYTSTYMVEYLIKHHGLKSFNVEKALVSNQYILGEEIFGNYMNGMYLKKMEQDSYLEKIEKFNKEKETRELTDVEQKEYDECASQYNPVMREIYKLLMNALTGKLVEDKSKYKSKNIVEMEEEACMKRDKRLGAFIVEEEEEECFNHFMPLGTNIYLQSKMILFDYIEALPNKQEDVIHCETDSLFFYTKHIKEFEKNLSQATPGSMIAVGKHVGNIKQETKYTSTKPSYFLMKKGYYLENDNKKKFAMKGIPKKTVEKDGSETKTNMLELFETLHSGKPYTVSFNRLEKKLWCPEDGKPKIYSMETKRTVKSDVSLMVNGKYKTYS